MVVANQSTTMQSFCDLETPLQERLRHGVPGSAPADSWFSQLARLLGPSPMDQDCTLLTQEKATPASHPATCRCPSC
jgi:hypothetical protein